MRKIKHQTLLVSYPQGTSPGVYETSVELDSGFEKCDGIKIEEISGGTVPYFEVGVADDMNVYKDLSHKNDLIASTSVEPNKRFLEVEIPNHRQAIRIKTRIPQVEVLGRGAIELEPGEPTSNNIEYQITFRLRNENRKTHC